MKYSTYVTYRIAHHTNWANAHWYFGWSFNVDRDRNRYSTHRLGMRI